MEVEIWSDVACPWCYIGKRRFEAALSQFEHSEDVQVRWRSFELDGEAPHERMGDRAEHLAKKYGMTVEQAREAGQGDRFTAEVRDDERTAGELGISQYRRSWWIASWGRLAHSRRRRCWSCCVRAGREATQPWPPRMRSR